MSLDNFKNRAIVWDTVNKDFPQPIQIMQGDANARTLSVKIIDNGGEVDLTGHSLKLTYQYTNSSNSGFVMIPPENLTKGEFILVIPTEMAKAGVIEANLILLNEDKEQVIVSKNLTFISDNSTVTSLAQEVNNKIDDFTKLLLENMPQVMRSELNDLHAQTESNKRNIELKANLADMTSLQSAMIELKNEVEAFGISPENLVTIKSLLDAIASNASKSEVVELINSVKVLTSNISLMSNGDYSPKANQKDLVDIVDGLQMYHINDFNKKDVTLDRYLGHSVGETSMYDSPIPSSHGFVCNKIYKITPGDVIYTNNGSVIPFLYDSNGLFLERLTDESIKNKHVENEQARYMKWQYGSKNELGTIMINVGHPLPDDYVGYDAVSITTEETKEMEERVNILENPEVANKSKCYVLLSFDDQTQMYADRFPIMKEYGFPFTFCLNSGFQHNNGFANDSEKQTFFEMLSYGCDVAQYHIGRNISGIGENSTVEEWQNAVSNLLDFINDYGIYPVTYFARQNVLYDNAIKALKNLGFEISRSGMYSPENDYRWVESFDDSRFNTPCYPINATNLENCKEYLDACVQNGWSIAFMTHRLTGTDDNNCDESTFRTLMDYIKNYTNQGKCEVVTYQSFLNNKTKKGKEIENLRKVKRLNWIQSKIN